MKMILRENALESWASAIKYSEELMLGKATFSNRKNFVTSLQNAIELFVKQYMLNINDYRVADVKNIKADGTPLKQYLMSDDLNNFFLKTMNTTDMKNFYTLEFSKIKNIQKDLFKEFYDNNPGKEISAYLTTLQRLRNNETHFCITDEEFVSDSEFKDLYNLMLIFYEILKYYNLLPYWGKPFGAYKRFSFIHKPLTSFSYKDQLKKNEFVQRLKRNIEENIYPLVSDKESYSIAENLISFTNAYSGSDFDELWEYVQVLLKFGLLSVDLFEGEGVDDKKEIRDWCMYHIKL